MASMGRHKMGFHLEEDNKNVRCLKVPIIIDNQEKLLLIQKPTMMTLSQQQAEEHPHKYQESQVVPM
jgi:hypothetical protein